MYWLLCWDMIQFMFKCVARKLLGQLFCGMTLWQEILIHRPILKLVSQPFWAHLALLLHLFLCLPTPTTCSPFVSVLQGWQLSSWYDLLFSFCEVGFELGQLLLLTSLPQCACWCALTVKCKEGDSMEWLGACKDAYLFFMVMEWINW